MPLDEILLEAEEKMEASVRNLTDGFRTLRTGRASPSLVEGIKVDCYGSTTPIKQLGSIGAPDPRQLVIRPFDRSIIGAIEKAILKSDLGLTPNSDGKILRLPIPPLSEERRKKLLNRLKEMSEETRVKVRNIRREANRLIDQEQKGGDIPEDQAYSGKDETQSLTKKYEGEVDTTLKAKSTEVMEV